MKILFIARTCPYPPNDGEKIRVFNVIKNLSQHEVTLVYRVMNDDELNSADELKKYCTNVVPVYIPSPKSIVQKIMWVMPFLISRYPLGLSTVYFKKIMNKLHDLNAGNTYDIIQVEHSSLTIYLDKLKLSPNVKTILTMHNVDYVRNERVINNLSFGIEKLYQILNQRKFKEWEIGSLKKYSKVIAMSDVDKEIMLSDSPDLDVNIVPNGVDIDAYNFDIDERLASVSNIIVFVASMDSEANHDAAMYFIDSIFPHVKEKLPELKVYMVGRSPKAELAARDNNKDIFVTGKVDSVERYYKMARVSIVPLRSGGGTRLKIMESMAAGVPVVSTSVGAEGIDVESGVNIMLADEAQAFANDVCEIFTNKELYMHLIRNARSKVENVYDWKIISKSHDAVYRDCV